MKKGTDYNVIVDIPEGAHKCKDGRVYVVLEKRYYQDLHYNTQNSDNSHTKTKKLPVKHDKT